nr:hypothetical protein CFP56_14315 [Quercus suber]
MPRDHAYYCWYHPVTQKYVDRNNAKLDIMANNGHENESAATVTPSTSAALVSTSTLGRHATASPSTSTARGRGQPAIATPSTSATRGCGWRATTPQVVTSLEIPAPISHTSPQPEVPPPIPDTSPQSKVSPPMVDASPQPEVPSPTPPSQPNFDLRIDQNLTPPILPETPSYPPTNSSAPTHQLQCTHSWLLQRASLPTYLILIRPSRTFGWDLHYNHILMYWTSIPLISPHPHEVDRNALEEHPLVGQHDDEPKDDALQPPPPPKHYTRVKKRKIGEP